MTLRRVTFDKNKTGFTIVELLVVIVVIAILASITIVSYNGIVRSAAETSMKSDLRNAATTLEIDRAANGTYPPSGAAANNNKGLQNSQGNTLSYTQSDGGFCLSVTSIRTPQKLVFTNDGQIQEGECPLIATAVSAGSSHTCAVASGRAYCWGSGTAGQLGNGSTGSQLSPVAVSTTGALSGKTVTAVAVGNSYTCAIADGRAYCWGSNTNGQLGNGSTGSQPSPVAVDTSTGLGNKTVTSITAGASHSCAVADGWAYCWGLGTNYRLGSGSETQQNSPIAIVPGSIGNRTITELTTSNNHTCGIADSTAYCWGLGTSGQLGNGASATETTPVPVDTSSVLGNKTVTSIAAGASHSCVSASGEAYCWGSGTSGRLGNGTTVLRNSPVAATGALVTKNTIVTTAGTNHSCAIADGRVYCWGSSTSGQIGNGGTAQQTTPVDVNTSGVLAGRTATAVSAGGSHTCAIASGKVFCWGFNSTGQLGTSDTSTQPNPVSVNPFPEV